MALATDPRVQVPEDGVQLSMNLGHLPEPSAAPRRKIGRNPDLLSPLRYPGGKRQLVPFFVDLLKLNGMSPLGIFVEPFAGGGAVSLHLLASGLVERVVLADLDPLVYSFWHQACFNTEKLVDDIAAADVTLEEWHRLRADPGKTVREKAYACLFLNRTSYSGILNGTAGPIGGQKQQSKYKIDCRFSKDEIILRLRQIGELASTGRIAAVRQTDVRTTVGWVEKNFSENERLYYFDPPFWEKGGRLYRKSFGRPQHERLANLLTGLQTPWVLSYDYHEEIVDLYRASAQAGDQCQTDLVPAGAPRLHTTDLLYCNRHERRGVTELIITNLPEVPQEHVSGT
ncbi:DNA adenine methylase [Streptomyces sp. NPDC093221]|uniref:DNA adenine methylase n=1 Tax=Streptomyces sp. NPDC093221 TaxID=3366032 RepID=UPI003811005B